MTTIDSCVLLFLINKISHESVIRNPLISLKTHKSWRFYEVSPWGASQSIKIWRIPDKCNRFLLNFLSCGMLSAWCAKLVLKTCRLNFHSPNQSILKEVFLMACRNKEHRAELKLSRHLPNCTMFDLSRDFSLAFFR